MERITGEHHPEKEEQVFVNEIEQLVSGIFPFDTPEQRREFTEGMQRLAGEVQSSDGKIVERVRSLLAKLAHGHLLLEEETNQHHERKDSDRKRFVSSKLLDGNIGYLKITSWSPKAHFDGKNIAELVAEELETLGSPKSFIIDVRKNDGGASNLAAQLAGRFVDEPTAYATAMRRKEGGDVLEPHDLVLKPVAPMMHVPCIILTGPICWSSNELFILMLKDTGHAMTIGETTGGSSGNPQFFHLQFGDKKYRLSVPTWKILRKNGQELEGKGIEPDIEVHPTAQDVSEGKDAVLERAVQYLRELVV